MSGDHTAQDWHHAKAESGHTISWIKPGQFQANFAKQNTMWGPMLYKSASVVTDSGEGKWPPAGMALVDRWDLDPNTVYRSGRPYKACGGFGNESHAIDIDVWVSFVEMKATTTTTTTTETTTEKSSSQRFLSGTVWPLLLFNIQVHCNNLL